MSSTTVNNGSHRSRVSVTMGDEDPRYSVLPVIDGLEAAGYVYRRRDEQRIVLTLPTSTVWLTLVGQTDAYPNGAVVIDAWGLSADELVAFFVTESLDHGLGSQAKMKVIGTIADVEFSVAA